MAEPALIASYWTLAGDVVPLGRPEQEASPHDLLDRVAVAASIGYRGIGLMVSDLLKIRQRYDYADLRSLFADHSIEYIELEFLIGWMGDDQDLRLAEETLAVMLEAAEHLPVRHLKVGPDMNAYAWPLERMVERFTKLCQRAESKGTRIAFELMPWSNVRDLNLAAKIVLGAGCKNGGLLLDIWHLARGGISYAEIPKLPPDLVCYVELNDADEKVRGGLLDDTLNHRKFCGDGDLNVVEFLQALQRYGYDGPYGVEILSQRERQRPFALTARDAFNTTMREFRKL